MQSFRVKAGTARTAHRVPKGKPSKQWWLSLYGSLGQSTVRYAFTSRVNREEPRIQRLLPSGTSLVN